MPQVARPIILDLPERFKTELDTYLDYNPPNWNYHLIYFYYLVHYLALRYIQKKKKKEEFFAINTIKIREATIWNIDKYILYLVKGELLERDYYIKGERPYHYKLNPKYLQGHCQVSIEPTTKLWDGIIHESRLQRSHANQESKHLRSMRKQFMSLDLDYQAARVWIDRQHDESKKFIYHTTLTQIQDKRFRYCKRNKTNNRLDTNLTNLKSNLRQYIIGDYMEIDLKNSQPFLFGILLNNISQDYCKTTTNRESIPLCYSTGELDPFQWFGKQTFNQLGKISLNGEFDKNGEFFKYLISVGKGAFYDDFLNCYSGLDLCRDDVKEIIFTVFFSQNEYYKKHKRIVPFRKEKAQFASVYPSVYNIIYELKRKDHSKLAIYLQRLESKVFIDTICPQLVDLGIIPLTIHDSIIIPTEKADQAFELCQRVFKELFGVIPTFHRKPIR